VTVRALPGLLLLLAGAVSCGEPVASVQDSATCPGKECADDARARFDAIGDIGGVVDVVEVSRDYGLDRGASRRAEVTAEVGSARQAREIGLAVVRALEDWPDHADGPAVVVVRAAERARGPAETTLLLDGDWVCEQEAGVRRPCGPDNSWLITGEPVR
jgi:hypothetical protein